ncbi:hypothetical protein ACFE04_026219 [Oxalis oulophora]
MAKSNLRSLYELGACLLHGVDAATMRFLPDLHMRKFDRIIFNFPHAGFYRNESHPDQIRLHKNVVDGFFNNARGMLRYDGEVHVNHKIKVPYNCWNLQELASRNSLRMFECNDFKIKDYPGYNHKRGSGKKSDEPFTLGSCCTFKFKVDLSYANRTCRKHLTPVVPFRHREEIFFEHEMINYSRNMDNCVTNNMRRESLWFSTYGCVTNSHDLNYVGGDNWTNLRRYEVEARERTDDIVRSTNWYMESTR